MIRPGEIVGDYEIVAEIGDGAHPQLTTPLAAASVLPSARPWQDAAVSPPPSRCVFHEDALPWLQERGVLEGASVITSLPDVSGLPELGLPAWKTWFLDAAERVIRATPPTGVSIFYQTDVRHLGIWIDKAYLCHQAADRASAWLLWHKIVCRSPAGTATFGRPAYSHLLCYSRGVQDDSARARRDVLATTGKLLWPQGMGVDACNLACNYVLEQTETRTIVDPFCGLGTVLAVANNLGMDAIGVERNRKRARKAQSCQIGPAAPPPP